jgi:hypothetical protein
MSGKGPAPMGQPVGPHRIIHEWCLKEKVYGNLLCKNIEIIYLKMMVAWSISPCEHVYEDKYIELYESRTSTSLHSSAQPSWKPTLQDVENDIFMDGLLVSSPDHWADFEGKLMEILTLDTHRQISLDEYLQTENLLFVKNLMNILLDSDDEEDTVDMSDLEEEETSDVDFDDDWDSSEEDDEMGDEYPTEEDVRIATIISERMKTEKKKKESCMDAMNLLDTMMKSGECMKEADYLQMCNLLKELYH